MAIVKTSTGLSVGRYELTTRRGLVGRQGTTVTATADVQLSHARPVRQPKPSRERIRVTIGPGDDEGR